MFTVLTLGVTQYVNPQLAERLKNMNISFIDTVGNVYINEPPLLIFVTGNKSPKLTQTSAFSNAGLKVIFLLLCKPEYINSPYRNIAKMADVALGAIGGIITQLKTLGYLIDKGKAGRKFTNQESLIERWVIEYAERLRPKLVIGHYQSSTSDWWKKVNMASIHACWGGEVAAAKLTQYLKPEMITLYAENNINNVHDFLFENKLIKQPKGNIEILQKFWKFEREDESLTPPLLVYADLITSGDPRNLEVAKIIYEQEFSRYLTKD